MSDGPSTLLLEEAPHFPRAYEVREPMVLRWNGVDTNASLTQLSIYLVSFRFAAGYHHCRDTFLEVFSEIGKKGFFGRFPTNDKQLCYLW